MTEKTIVDVNKKKSFLSEEFILNMKRIEFHLHLLFCIFYLSSYRLIYHVLRSSLNNIGLVSLRQSAFMRQRRNMWCYCYRLI